MTPHPLINKLGDHFWADLRTPYSAEKIFNWFHMNGANRSEAATLTWEMYTVYFFDTNGKITLRSKYSFYEGIGGIYDLPNSEKYHDPSSTIT